MFARVCRVRTVQLFKHMHLRLYKYKHIHGRKLVGVHITRLRVLLVLPSEVMRYLAVSSCLVWILMLNQHKRQYVMFSSCNFFRGTKGASIIIDIFNCAQNKLHWRSEVNDPCTLLKISKNVAQYVL